MTQDTSFRELIELKGDLGLVIHQKTHAILGTHRYSRSNRNYDHTKLLLFYPWRYEAEIKDKYESYQDHYNIVKDVVENNASHFNLDDDTFHNAPYDHVYSVHSEPAWYTSVADDRSMKQHQKEKEDIMGTDGE